jgi:hypothetical protein
MTTDGSHARMRTAQFPRAWDDFKADLAKWSRGERVSAALIAGAIVGLPVTLALIGQG